MRTWPLPALLVIAVGCGDAAMRPDARLPDAACSPAVFTPVEIAGTYPGGSLSRFHYLFASHLGGFCGNVYVVTFAEVPDYCFLDPTLTLYASVNPPESQPVAGDVLPVQAVVRGRDEREYRSDAVEMHVTELRPGTGVSSRVAGRFVAAANGWALDITVDTFSQFSDTCL